MTISARATPATALRATCRWLGASLIAASVLPLGIDDQRLVTAASLVLDLGIVIPTDDMVAGAAILGFVSFFAAVGAALVWPVNRR